MSMDYLYIKYKGSGSYQRKIRQYEAKKKEALEPNPIKPGISSVVRVILTDCE